MTTRCRQFRIWICIAVASLGFSGAMAAGEDASFGPLFQEFELTLNPGHRTEILGPFFYSEEEQENHYRTKTWAIPPLLGRLSIEEIDVTQTDILWKLLSYRSYGDEYRVHLGQLFSFAGGGTQSETNVSRFTLFPIYFQQRSAIPEKNYTAFLPFYGTIKQRLGKDEIQFAAFPLWAKTRKRNVVTENYLFPVVHRRSGPALKGWQVWPLVGQERKDFTTITNVWGDPEPAPGHASSFVLWPFFVNQRTGLGTTNEAHVQAMIPFYSSLRSPLRDAVTYPWPLGYSHTIDREKRYEEWGAPWPLIVFARGEGKRMNRVWPFFSHGTNLNLTGAWYAWPIYKYNRLYSPPLDRERTRLLFFLYSNTRVRDTVNRLEKRRVDLWPLFTSTRELDGSRRLQILAPLEPIISGSSSLQRDLSPLWSIWRAERDPHAGKSSQSLFWNLYRRDVTPQSRKGSLLFGLFQYESGPNGRRGRVFYIPVGGKRNAHSQADDPAPK